MNEGRGFSHPFVVRAFSPFPDDLYQDVLANLPDDNCYVPLPHEDSDKRTVMLLNWSSPPFWRELSKTLCNKNIEDNFRKHLGFKGNVRAVARLLRDFSGYKINPHPDSSKKACTVQFYLPADDAQSDVGTSFYSKHSDGFKEEQKLKFLPNTGYCFKVTENSWHGCDFQILTKPRNTLILTYYKAKN